MTTSNARPIPQSSHCESTSRRRVYHSPLRISQASCQERQILHGFHKPGLNYPLFPCVLCVKDFSPESCPDPEIRSANTNCSRTISAPTETGRTAFSIG